MDTPTPNPPPQNPEPASGDTVPGTNNIGPLAEDIQVNTSVPVTNAASSQPTQPMTETPATQAAPNQTRPAGKKVVKGKKIGAGFFLGCFGLFAFLFVLFVLLSVFAFNGDPNNPFFKQLGLDPAAVKNLLSSLVNISFGFFSMLLLIAVVVNIFRRILTHKDDKAGKRKTTIAIFITTLILLVDIVIWVFAFFSIGQVRVDGNSAIQGDIVVYNAQTREPLAVTTGLTAPIELIFDASNLENKLTRGYEIVKYDWDFTGDGKSDRIGGKEERWNYDKTFKAGNYPVTLTITAVDNKGEEKTQQFKKNISIAYLLPVAVINVDKDKGEAPLTVTLDASESYDPNSQDPKDVTYAWEIDGDNRFNEGTTPKLTYTFETIGTYTVRLRVENRDKKYNTAEKVITITGVRDDTVKASILAVPMEGDAPLTVNFDASESRSPAGKIVKYEWDFGDNTLREKTVTATHTFKKPGTYKVNLALTDDKSNQGSSSVDIIVKGKTSSPVIQLKTTPSFKQGASGAVIEGSVPLAVTFDASASTDKDNDIVDYQWDFDGDGNFETRGAKPDVQTFYEEGERTVTLKVVDAQQNEVSQTILIKTKAKPLEAIIKASPLSGAAPLTVLFDASASRYNGGTITQYQWDFDDGTPPKIYGAQIQYTFAQVGVYKVQLTVFTNDAKKETATQDIVVSEVPVVARFKTNVKTGAAPLSVVFDPTESNGPIAKYFWDFGDGTVSTDRKPTHVFTTPGTYMVVLTITSKDNISSQFSEQVGVE